jgi:iron complex transport system permease protein
MVSRAKKMGASPVWRWIAFLALAIIVVVAAFSMGAPVPLSDVWSGDAARAEIARRIFWMEGGVWGLRPMRLAAGALAGASLALAGASLQSIFRNSLAEPYLLGTSAGGALGAAIGLALQGSAPRVLANLPAGFELSSLLAFGGALATTTLVYALGSGASTLAGDARGGLLLTGVAVSSFASAMMALIVSLGNRTDLAQQITFWMLGSLTRATSTHIVTMLIAFAVGFALLLASARDINALRGGDEDAASLGVPVERLHRRLIFCAAILSAATVAAAGLIGFVGLMGPHLVRRVFGGNARVLLPASALGGAALLVACDALARSVARPVELPVGIITSLLGVPLFLALTRKK